MESYCYTARVVNVSINMDTVELLNLRKINVMLEAVPTGCLRNQKSNDFFFYKIENLQSVHI